MKTSLAVIRKLSGGTRVTRALLETDPGAEDQHTHPIARFLPATKKTETYGRLSLDTGLPVGPMRTRQVFYPDRVVVGAVAFECAGLKVLPVGIAKLVKLTAEDQDRLDQWDAEEEALRQQMNALQRARADYLLLAATKRGKVVSPFDVRVVKAAGQ